MTLKINHIQDRPSRDAHRLGAGGKKIPVPKICHTCSPMMKLGTVIPYLRKTLNLYESPGPSHVTRVLTSFFSDQKSRNLLISQNTNIDCILVLNF